MADRPSATSAKARPVEPADAGHRRSAPPIVCYAVEQLPVFDRAFYTLARKHAGAVDQVRVAPRDASTFIVRAGQFFRIGCTEGPQVGDLNLWNLHDINERFFSGKTRQLHATHLSTGDRLWSNLPGLRPLATITDDTLGWYGWDQDGAGVHDVIGTRCDPYTNYLLKETEYHNCCHSNLSRALGAYLGETPAAIEHHVHDVLNVFMCTGFTRDTHQYFMKASPVRPGDYIEFFAETDLLGALSACPGGDCASSHSDDLTPCYPLLVDIYQPDEESLQNWHPFAINGYGRSHGVDGSG